MSLLAGDIYLGVKIKSAKEVAIRLKSVKAKHPQLKYKSKVFKILAGGVGVLLSMVQNGMQLQCNGHRPPRPLAGESVQLLSFQIQSKDCFVPCRSTGQPAHAVF